MIGGGHQSRLFIRTNELSLSSRLVYCSTMRRKEEYKATTCTNTLNNYTWCVCVCVCIRGHDKRWVSGYRWLLRTTPEQTWPSSRTSTQQQLQQHIIIQCSVLGRCRCCCWYEITPPPSSSSSSTVFLGTWINKFHLTPPSRPAAGIDRKLFPFCRPANDDKLCHE